MPKIRPDLHPDELDPELIIDPCGRGALASHPPLDGRSNDPGVSGVKGLHCTDGVAVGGNSHGGTGVMGEGKHNGVIGVSRDGRGVYASSETGEAIYGETKSTRFAAVVGVCTNSKRGSDGSFPTGVWGSSRSGEGVHGESSSDVFAAVAGVQLNPDSTGAGVYGEHRGDGPAGFFKGNVVVTKDIFLSNADCAEDFDLASSVAVEPGTVMVIDEDGGLRQCEAEYDRKVAGVVSGAGAFKPAIVLDRRHVCADRAPIALVGKVYCKVDASYGAIRVGDLLTSSPRAGHAMKAADPARAFGAVIGKALGAQQAGTGLIPVLISLQ